MIERFVPGGELANVLTVFNQAVAAGQNLGQLVRTLRNTGLSYTEAYNIVNGVSETIQQAGATMRDLATEMAPRNIGEAITGVGGAITGGILGGPVGAVSGGLAGIQGGRSAQDPDSELNNMIDEANRNNPFNGGRTPINSGGGPVRDVGTGGRPHNPNSGMADSAGPVFGPPTEAEALRASGGGGGPNPVSKETPVSSYPSLTYGVQETHTTILPWVMWCGLALDKNATTPQQLKIRLNSMYDMIDNTIIAGAADDTLFSGPGFVNKKVGFNGKTPISGNPFPVVPTAGALSTERPQWREYWAQLYQYYTVLGCEYEVIMVNPIGNYQQQSGGSTTQLCFGGDIICAEQVDTYSDTAAPTGNVMPLTTLVEVMNYKNIKWHKIEANGVGTNMGNTTIVKGRYTPGSTKRNIVNDGDVKTWTAMGSQPTLKEFLTLNFWPHPLSAGTHFGMNIQIRLKYIVQYKDLVAQARYPNSLNATGNVAQDIRNADTAANQILSDDVRQSIP